MLYCCSNDEFVMTPPKYSNILYVCSNLPVFSINFHLGFPGGSDGKESACYVGDLGSIPRLGRSPGGGKVYPPQYSGLESFMDCIEYCETSDCRAAKVR